MLRLQTSGNLQNLIYFPKFVSESTRALTAITNVKANRSVRIALN